MRRRLLLPRTGQADASGRCRADAPAAGRAGTQRACPATVLAIGASPAPNPGFTFGRPKVNRKGAGETPDPLFYPIGLNQV